MSEVPLRFGIEVWAAGGGAAAAGRLAYVGNRASVAADGRTPGATVLQAADGTIVAHWTPEHGIGGAAPPGATVDDGQTDAGVPVFSLYGPREAPDATMLDMVDTIVLDLQDVGARYYTFWYVVKRCLEAGARADKRVVVCDRPNPLGAARWGNVLPPERDVPVGCWPMAMQHGLTAGDVAGAWHLAQPGARVERVLLQGWRRTQEWADLELAWVPPSPNLPSLAAVVAYPGTCLAEGLTVSVGRGTPWPFHWVGAPWLAAEAITAEVAASCPGWRAEAVACVPTKPPYAGESCDGVRLTRAERGADPLPPALTLISAAVRRHPGECRFHVDHFDALAGGPALRTGLLAGRSVPTLMDTWAAARATAGLKPSADYA